MVGSIARTLLILTLTLGFLAPKLSAVAMEFMPGLRTVVICTGAELITLTLNEEGEPVEAPEVQAQHCVLADLTEPSHSPPALWHTLASNYHHPFTIKLHPAPNADALAHIWPSRAPPEVI